MIFAHIKRFVALVLLVMGAQLSSFAQFAGNVVDEVIWVVGDEAILRSDVEKVRTQMTRVTGNPYCVIPENLAIQKLFLHQAQIDSIEAAEEQINRYVEAQINQWVQAAGSKEKLEEYRNMSMAQIREETHDLVKDNQVMELVREHLTKDIKVTPAEVRHYFKDIPEDSLPLIPTQVEVELLAEHPRIQPEEIERVKSALREYAERIQSGSSSFSTLAILYSEDPGSARQGGEMDYMGKMELDPAFANVAWSLNDPKKVSKIVESEFGFHIIQLIDKRGDKVNVRHILRKPVVSQEAIDRSLARLDSIRTEILDGKFSFEAGASVISDDKDTRNNNGLMANATQSGRTSRFRLQDLPSEIARAVDTLQVGNISRPFQMINERGKTMCVIAKLKSRTEGHKATITEDFQVMKDVVMEKRRQEKLHEWVVNKIKSTYVRVNDRYRDCQFEYQGWIK